MSSNRSRHLSGWDLSAIVRNLKEGGRAVSFGVVLFGFGFWFVPFHMRGEAAVATGIISQRQRLLLLLFSHRIFIRPRRTVWMVPWSVSWVVMVVVVVVILPGSAYHKPCRDGSVLRRRTES